jgi:hypothetical protein
MPTHYVYEVPSAAILCQGDVLRKTPDLVSCIEPYFRYYATHESYKYFMVVTQTCDLVRRKPDNRPGAPYITLAAVRPLRDAIDLEVKGLVSPWQLQASPRLLRRREGDQLSLFIQRLFDNNEPGFFYLHPDVDAGIDESCCAFLQLTISLREVHFEKLLAAKVAQLKEPFQAKLGWLLGHMYSRVGTAEWNEQPGPGNNVQAAAAAVLETMFVQIRNDQVDAGLSELGTIAGKTPDEIVQFILSTRVQPRDKKFAEHATNIILNNIKLFDRIQTAVVPKLIRDPALRDALVAIIEQSGASTEIANNTADLALAEFKRAIKAVLNDADMPDKRAIIDKTLIGALMQKPAIKSILK